MLATDHAVLRTQQRLDVPEGWAEEVLEFLWGEGWHASIPDMMHFRAHRAYGYIYRVAVYEGQWVLIVRHRMSGSFVTVIKE